MMSLLKRGFLILLVIGLIVGLSPFLWRNAVRLYYHGSIYTPDSAPTRPTAIVFGAAVYANGRLSAVLVDRVETAIDLYNRGQVGNIIMSGDNSTAHYDEPGAMVRYAIDRGVDPDDLITDRAGRRTYDTCYRAMHVFDVRDAILVTQAFHLPRALLTCEGLGIDAVGVSADKRPYRAADWYEFRETAATTIAAWDVFRRQPPPLFEAAEEFNRSWPSTLAAEN